MCVGFFPFLNIVGISISAKKKNLLLVVGSINL